MRPPREPLLAGDYRVQLGSLRTETAAETLWGQMRQDFPDHLSDLKLHIQKVNLGGKGMYFRVQAGPLEKVQAESVCNVIEQKRKGGCLVIRR